MITANDINKIIGKNLKKLRTSKGITQEELAEILKLQPQSVTVIETGRTFISGDVLEKICNYFNIEPSVLFKLDYLVPTDKTNDLRKEINRILADCSQDFMEKIYNIIITLKN